MIRNARLGSLGSYDTEGNYIPDTPAPDIIPAGTYSGGYTDPYAPVVLPAPSQGSGNWAAAAGIIATDASKLAAPFIQAQLPPPVYVQGSGGAQVLYNPSTGQITQAKQTLPSGLTSPVGTGIFSGGTSIPLLVLLALGIGLAMETGKH